MHVVLYCGMADDILAPLILEPNLDIIYVIDRFDSAFAKDHTWEGQMEDILTVMKNGNDETSHHREIYLQYDSNTDICALSEACTVVSEDDNGTCWTVEFSYLGKDRKLYYYHHRDFIEEWPSEVQDVNAVMSMGAEFPLYDTRLKKNIHERTDRKCLYYALDFLHEYFPCKVADSIIRRREEVGVAHIRWVLRNFKLSDK